MLNIVRERLHQGYRTLNYPFKQPVISPRFAGLPSITMPLGYEKGMPFGANLMGKAFEEGSLLSFACAYERMTGLGGSYYEKEKK